MRDKGRGRMGEGQGRQGHVGQGRAGLGRTAGRNPVVRTTTDQNQIRETKYEMRLSNTRD
jgi:hypothetical protein